jgi:hypothetical protein
LAISSALTNFVPQLRAAASPDRSSIFERIGANMPRQQESSMTPRELKEYSALRATIRQRGNARPWLAVAGLAAWSAEALAIAVLAPPPAVALVPLLILAASFEAVFALHVGVERIGRYVQVFHEAAGEPAAWEGAAMAFGRPPRGTATDPLFAAYFGLAALLNFVPVMLAVPVPVEALVIGGAHLLFVARIAAARRAAAGQRAADLARFQTMKDTPA